jgi:hypothetical protein
MSRASIKAIGNIRSACGVTVAGVSFGVIMPTSFDQSLDSSNFRAIRSDGGDLIRRRLDWQREEFEHIV